MIVSFLIDPHQGQRTIGFQDWALDRADEGRSMSCIAGNGEATHGRRTGRLSRRRRGAAAVLVAATLGLIPSATCAQNILGIIDGLVNDVGVVVKWISNRFKLVQTGYVRTYAVSFLLGVVLVIVILILPALQR